MAIWLGKQYLDQKEPMDVQRIELELLKLESQMKDSQTEEEAEDNFLDALNGSAVEVWEESAKNESYETQK